jgi:glycosyltransferase involved in cell wall biosynthesis
MAAAVISPSADWARRVSSLPGVGDVYVIANGFDLSRYPAAPARAPQRAHPRIVCVGELTRRKGQDLLVQAMPRLWATIPGATLDLIGDGDAADAIRSLAREVDAEGGRIRVLGHQAYPYERVCEADVFCLPSRSDNQPVAIIEAMCAGVPVLATDVGGIPELVHEAGAGVVVPAESAAALAEGLATLLRRDDLQGLGARGRDFARREYAVALMADRVEGVYRACGVGGPLRSQSGPAVVQPLRRS